VFDETPSKFVSEDLPLRIFDLTKQRLKGIIQNEEYERIMAEILP